MSLVERAVRYFREHGAKATVNRAVGGSLGVPSRFLYQLAARLDPDLGHRVSNENQKPINILGELASQIGKLENPRILEIGSRNVTDEPLRYMLNIQTPHSYSGFDIHAGPNVDVVGDAHELSVHYPPNQFDVVLSKAVFEHLAMPWKAVLEINRVMKQGGWLFINTLHTWPAHEKPWDFWRFSDDAWHALLNPVTGFEIVSSNLEFPCKIVANPKVVPDWQLRHEAYLLSNVLARKLGDFDGDKVRWDVEVGDFLKNEYPK